MINLHNLCKLIITLVQQRLGMDDPDSPMRLVLSRKVSILSSAVLREWVILMYLYGKFS